MAIATTIFGKKFGKNFSVDYNEEAFHFGLGWVSYIH